ncbi:MAG: dihydropyrimidinase [Planctomycetes bacterium]|nr:dihydropyrimidinase [Planctomycetota bacterium]
MELKIIGGTVVTAEKSFRADVGIQDGKITRIATSLADQPGETIDATGQYILPGGIDVHTHFELPFGGTVSPDDFFTGTVAAACGGTTTILDFAVQSKGQGLKEGLESWQEKARDKAVIDYGFHMAITDFNRQVVDDMEAMMESGVTSFKLFMAYKNIFMVDDETLFRSFLKAKELGGLVMVHAENGGLIDLLTNKLLAEGKTQPMYHALSRPPELEEEATSRAIILARLAEAPLYVVHLSYRGAMRRVKKARANQQPVLAETCPHYLMLSIENYSEPDFAGAKYVMSPPLRGKHNQAYLWKNLAEGHLQVVSSDHCSFNLKGQKDLGRDDFSRIPNGVPGVETRLFILYSEGVRHKKITLERLVDVWATSPAKIFGLYPQKGVIAEGSDADLVIFNPNKKFVLQSAKLHQNVDYCPYEGLEVKGAISRVLSRGKVIVKENSFSGRRGAGQFLRRRKFKPSESILAEK